MPLWTGSPLTKDGVILIELADGNLVIWNDTVQNRVIGCRMNRVGTSSGEASALASAL